MIFDSHCHPQFPQYDQDRGEMLARAQAAGVGMICIGTDLETSKKGIELAQKHDNMWATAGIHPNDVDSLVLSQLPSLVDLLNQPKVVAVGEIGLDYYRTEGEEDQKRQKNLFIEQLELAKKENLPVVLHCRDLPRHLSNPMDGKSFSTARAYSDMISILGNWKLKIENSGRPWRAGVLHSCTASLDEAQQFIDLGFYLGFNGIITFADTYDEVVRATPLERILVETDAPYLAPEPYRGQRNEPAHVDKVLARISLLKATSLEETIAVTTANCRKLFHLD